VFESARWAAENKVQLITHANGERASDLLIAAQSAAQGRFPDAQKLRPVLIHGQAQRVDQVDSYKRLGVIQKFEEDTKGSLSVGKLADFAILSRDPTTGDPRTIHTIKVTETIKEGKTIFRLQPGKQAEAKPANIGPLLQVMASGGTPHAHPDGSECMDAAAVMTHMLDGSAVGP
jgi:predicted amidohydrolase YtcJ